MRKTEEIEELSLLGGPLQRLGCRLGLVRGESNTLRLGVSIGLLLWVVLVLLTFLEGFGPKLFSLSFIGVHVRFLAAIPLMFLCETWVVPEMAEFARYIVRSGLVPEDSLPALKSVIHRVRKMSDSWLPEGLLLLTAFALPLIETIVPLPGKTGSWVSILHSAGSRLPWATGWYLGLCLPLFRFLLLRWLWRLGLWWYFLWCVQKLDLDMIPTHSDEMAGLGYLEIVHENFFPLILAISAVCSAQFAEDISSGAMAFEALYGWIAIVLLLIAALFIAPLLMFSHKLWICRAVGMSEYMGMASRYVKAFDNKWIRDEAATGESQLGTGDLQSLADLTNSLNVVRNLRWIPVGTRQLMQLGACVIAPLVPLVLLKYPVQEVGVKLLRILTGL